MHVDIFSYPNFYIFQPKSNIAARSILIPTLQPSVDLPSYRTVSTSLSRTNLFLNFSTTFAHHPNKINPQCQTTPTPETSPTAPRKKYKTSPPKAGSRAIMVGSRVWTRINRYSLPSPFLTLLAPSPLINSMCSRRHFHDEELIWVLSTISPPKAAK